MWCALPIIGPVTVEYSHLRYPLRVGAHVAYLLITNAGEFVASQLPDFFDHEGNPIAMTGEIAAGSTVRLSLAMNDALQAVQIVAGRFEHPFGNRPRDHPNAERYKQLKRQHHQIGACPLEQRP